MSAPRLCKFGCGKELSWDAKNSRFIEVDGAPHTRERCESLQNPVVASPAANPKPDQRQLDIQKAHLENMQASAALTNAIRELAAAIRAGRMTA